MTDAFGGVIGPSWRESTAWWPPEPQPPEGAPNVRADRARRRRVRAARLLRLRHRHAEHRPARRGRRAVRELPHHRAVLADPRVPAHRAQPPLERDGAGRRSRGRLPRLLRPHPAPERLPVRDPGGERVRAGRGRQVAPHARRTRRTWPRRASTWPVGRGFQRWYGFHGGETHQFVPTLFQDNHAVRPPRTPERRLPPQRGPGRPRDPVPRRAAVGRARPAVLPLLRAPARATHRTTRRRSGSSATAAGSTRAGTRGATRRSPASRSSGCSRPGHAALAAPAVGAGVGRPRPRGPARRGAVHGVLRRLPVARRRADRSGARVRRGARRARQHARRARLRQRRERRGRRARLDQRRPPVERAPGRPPRAARAASTSSARRPRTTTTRGAGRWPATRRSGAGSARCTRAASPTRASSLAARHRRSRRDPPPVRARHRRAARPILELDRHRPARRRSTASRRARSTARASRTCSTTPRRARAPHDAVLRDARQPRHLPRRAGRR